MTRSDGVPVPCETEGIMIQAKPYLCKVILQREKIADNTVYPFSIPALQHMDSLSFHPDVTFLVGENGSQKCTDWGLP